MERAAGANGNRRRNLEDLEEGTEVFGDVGCGAGLEAGETTGCLPVCLPRARGGETLDQVADQLDEGREEVVAFPAWLEPYMGVSRGW